MCVCVSQSSYQQCGQSVKPELGWFGIGLVQCSSKADKLPSGCLSRVKQACCRRRSRICQQSPNETDGKINHQQKSGGSAWTHTFSGNLSPFRRWKEITVLPAKTSSCWTSGGLLRMWSSRVPVTCHGVCPWCHSLLEG